MQKLTTDWEEAYSFLLDKLEEVSSELKLSVRLGEDPMSAVNTAIDELQLFINAINAGGVSGS